jgi:hypothetical protein
VRVKRATFVVVVAFAFVDNNDDMRRVNVACHVVRNVCINVA